MRQDAAARPFERDEDVLSRVVHALAPNALLVVCVSAFSTALVWRLSGQVNQDAWLALASGREILRHGLPHSEALTIWAAGGPGSTSSGSRSSRSTGWPCQAGSP